MGTADREPPWLARGPRIANCGQRGRPRNGSADVRGTQNAGLTNSVDCGPRVALTSADCEPWVARSWTAVAQEYCFEGNVLAWPTWESHHKGIQCRINAGLQRLGLQRQIWPIEVMGGAAQALLMKVRDLGGPCWPKACRHKRRVWGFGLGRSWR